jgi:hypothetical protein
VYARRLAQQYGTNHRELEMQPDLVGLVSSLVRAFDQPSADSSAIPTWYLSQFTRKHVTVALSGLGGDEVAARPTAAVLAEIAPSGWVLRVRAAAGRRCPIAQRQPMATARGSACPRRACPSRALLRMLSQLAQRARDPDARSPSRSTSTTPLAISRLHARGRRRRSANRALWTSTLPGNLLAHRPHVDGPLAQVCALPRPRAASTPPSRPGTSCTRMERKHPKRAVKDLLPDDFPRAARWLLSAAHRVVRNGTAVPGEPAPQRVPRGGRLPPEFVRRMLSRLLTARTTTTRSAGHV